MIRILGISAFFHDSAAALIEDGVIVSAVQEERFTRVKNDPSFPIQAITWILVANQLSLKDIDYVVFYEKPFVRFERILETQFAFAPAGFRMFREAMPRWIKEKLFQRQIITRILQKLPGGKKGWNGQLKFSNHHLSHAASAFYPSPFKEAAILTIDGVGEWATTTVAIGEGKDIDIKHELHFPHSLGLLYSAITAFLGFKVNSGEYKIMGLAPYGTSKFAEIIKRELIHIKPDGSFRLNMDYFAFATDIKMTDNRLSTLLKMQPRPPGGPLDQKYKDLAASIQAVTEEIMLKLAQSVAQETGLKYLCLAGGVALNCVANGKILRKGYFEDIWVQPAAGDAGGAAGAALAFYHLALSKPRHLNRETQGLFLGPAFDQCEIANQLSALGAQYEVLDEATLIKRCSEDLAQELILGWMNGAAEFGPRALGNRSILGDPRPRDAQRTLNLKIKFRESFRPFAPAILAEKASNWFDLDRYSPHMAFTCPVHEDKKAIIPAVTHVDGSARVQTVTQQNNDRFYKLLRQFDELTGCPLLINTSFNVRGEPIVLTPTEAFNCFMNTEMDRLVIGNCLLLKEKQNTNVCRNPGDTIISD